MEIILSACAIFISMLALAYSIYEGRLTRKHNRLSVKPFIDFSALYSAAYPRHSLTLENKGLGPAKIKSFTLLADDKTMKILKIERWEQLSAYLGFKGNLDWIYITPNSIIQPGEKIEITGFPASTYHEETATLFRQAIRRLHIKIVYTSIYENEVFTGEFDGKKIIPEEKMG